MSGHPNSDIHSKITRVLLVEDNPADAQPVREMLAETQDIRFDVEYVRLLAEGLKHLALKQVDVILLGLSSPNALEFEAFFTLQAQYPEIPIIVLTALEDDTPAAQSIRESSQDYLVKGQVNSDLLVRSILYAIEHVRAHEQLRKYRFHLEELVEERLAELSRINKRLQQEIIDRKKAEEKTKLAYGELNQIFNLSADGMCVIDKELKVVRINETLCNLLGISKEDALGKSCCEILPDSLCGASNCPLTLILRGEARAERDAELHRKDGTKVPCIMTAIPFRKPDGILIGIVQNFKDITDRKRMEDELQKAQKLESIGILAGGIAHDFNNILTALGGSFYLARQYLKPTDKVSEILTKAEEATLRAKNLTKQLLTFSKGGAPIKKTTIIAKLLKDSASFALSGSKVKCEFFLPEDLWPVEIDEGQINQVINNIMINAEQAMPEGGIIKVRAENLTVSAHDILPIKKGEYIKIAIKDQGCGIPKKNLHKIFDPYFTTKPKGSGLGLAIAYSIIQKHEGYILAESKQEAGTTIYLYLPASRGKVIKEKAVEEGIFTGQGRILLMDDDEGLRDIAGLMLDYLGYEVEFACDGDEAIEMYRNAKESGQPFDAVIMDLTIPGGMGGMEAIRELLTIAPEVKAIVSSGYSNDPVMAEYSNYGFSGVVPKPYEINDLSEVLHKVLTH